MNGPSQVRTNWIRTIYAVAYQTSESHILTSGTSLAPGFLGPACCLSINFL